MENVRGDLDQRIPRQGLRLGATLRAAIQVAVIKGQQAFSSDTGVRRRAIRHAARTGGLPLDRRLVVQLEGDRSLPELGYEVTDRLLRQSTGFTAIFAFNDLSAFGAIGALRDAGLRVPADVSVVGFDDIPGAASHNPPLTTVRQPLARMGRIAAETVVKRIGSSQTHGTKCPSNLSWWCASTGPRA